MTDLTMSQFASKDDLLAAQAARIAELESQLAAIGAGGVEPLRKPAPSAAPAPDERAAFEAWLGIKPCGAAHDLAWSAWKARAALVAAQPAPAIFGDEDHVLVPRGLIGAACYAIDKKRDATKTLAELRRYTTGDLSAATQPAAQGMEQDAARYRWLRNHGFHSASAELGSDLDGAPFVCFVMRVHIPEPISLPYEEQEWTACDTDVAIDAALAAQAKQGGA